MAKKRARSKGNKEQEVTITEKMRVVRSPKIILSRKGTDCATGGLASPIISNHMISFPIPESSNSLIKYSNSNTPILTNDNVPLTFYDLISQLKGEIKINKSTQKISTLTSCHLDPDIDANAMPRTSDWTALFGQSGAAATHLHNEGITVGDIFLFFGWFRNTIKNDDKFIYDRKDKHGRHIIYGFMEVGNVLRIENDTVVPDWVQYHPHVSVGRSDTNNTIYVANKKATWNEELPGFGMFNYHDNLVLTKKDCTRSMWALPDIFKGVNITYHKPSSWKKDYFDSAKRGQEFVVSANTEILDWTKGLIKTHLKI